MMAHGVNGVLKAPKHQWKQLKAGIKMPPIEKHVDYNGSSAHIRIPESPTGLVFIAPGTAEKPNEPLVQTIREAYESKGMATVVADLSETPLNKDDPFNVHAHFAEEMRNVIDGYMADNEYTPDEFELAGHSAGAAAALSIAGEDYPVSKLTVLDLIPLSTETLQSVECPTNMIVSSVRQYKAPGRRMFNTLEENGVAATLHQIETSKEVESGHRFEGALSKVKETIASPEPESPSADNDLDGLEQ